MRNDGASHSLDPRARAELYCFLAAAYLRPLSPEALGYLTSKGVLQEFYSIYGERVKPALKCLLAAMCAMEDADRIRQEYMDLFAAPTGAYVMPFEDVYCGAAAGGGRGPLLGERAIAVRRLYREAGGGDGAWLQRTAYPHRSGAGVHEFPVRPGGGRGER